MARWSSTSRRRIAIGSVALALAGFAAGCGGPHVADGPARNDGSSDPVIICESGTVVQGNVHTSSAVAVRIAAGDPVPPGCRLA